MTRVVFDGVRIYRLDQDLDGLSTTVRWWLGLNHKKTTKTTNTNKGLGDLVTQQ